MFFLKTLSLFLNITALLYQFSIFKNLTALPIKYHDLDEEFGQKSVKLIINLVKNV